jgi:hypothetical protein
MKYANDKYYLIYKIIKYKISNDIIFDIKLYKMIRRLRLNKTSDTE